MLSNVQIAEIREIALRAKTRGAIVVCAPVIPIRNKTRLAIADRKARTAITRAKRRDKIIQEWNQWLLNQGIKTGSDTRAMTEVNDTLSHACSFLANFRNTRDMSMAYVSTQNKAGNYLSYRLFRRAVRYIEKLNANI